MNNYNNNMASRVRLELVRPKPENWTWFAGPVFLLCDQITKFLKTLLGKFVTVAAINDSRNDMTQVDFTNEGKKLSGK